MAWRVGAAHSDEPLGRAHRWVVIAGVVLVVLATIVYIVVDSWLVDQRAQRLIKAPGIIASSGLATGERASEGSDTTPVAVDDLSHYTVAADHPRVISIPRLGLNARVQPMGLNRDNSIQAPKNIYDAGWYTGSALSGAAGAMFVDGHASGASRQGLFGYLDTLQAGDVVTIERGDHARVKYEVVKVTVTPLGDVDMNAALAPYPGVERGLTLMTCTGQWVRGKETLDHRVVVYAKLVE